MMKQVIFTNNGRSRSNLGLGLASLCLTLLSACAVGPDYRLPFIETPQEFGQAVHPEFSKEGIELNWWTLFEDDQLTELVETAVEHNYDLKTAYANLEEARKLYLESGLDLLPAITSKAGYTDQKRSFGAMNNRNFAPRELKLYNIGFDAFWELDLFGRVRRSVEASDDEVDAQEASLRDLSVSLIAEVARNYFELRGLQNQLAVAQKKRRESGRNGRNHAVQARQRSRHRARHIESDCPTRSHKSRYSAPKKCDPKNDTPSERIDRAISRSTDRTIVAPCPVAEIARIDTDRLAGGTTAPPPRYPHRRTYAGRIDRAHRRRDGRFVSARDLRRIDRTRSQHFVGHRSGRFGRLFGRSENILARAGFRTRLCACQSRRRSRRSRFGAIRANRFECLGRNRKRADPIQSGARQTQTAGFGRRGESKSPRTRALALQSRTQRFSDGIGYRIPIVVGSGSTSPKRNSDRNRARGVIQGFGRRLGNNCKD